MTDKVAANTSTYGVMIENDQQV